MNRPTLKRLESVGQQPKLSTHIHDAKEFNAFAGAPTFAFRQRAERGFFHLAWFVMARWTPPNWRRWRNFLLRCFGADLHPKANIYPSARIWYPRGLVMDAYSTLGPGVICYCMDTIKIGERAVVSQRAHLCAGTHNPDDHNFQLYSRPIVIGPHAWIATESFVGPGVVVSEGAVLGARAVTVKDLEPWTIYAGNPARAIRKRKSSVR